MYENMQDMYVVWQHRGRGRRSFANHFNNKSHERVLANNLIDMHA